MLQVRPPVSHLAGLEPYDPKYLPARVYLNANENPCDPSAELRAELAQLAKTLPFNRYPDPLAHDLCAAIAGVCGVSVEQVLVGNGGDELLLNLLLAYGGRERRLLIAPPCFSSYAFDALLTTTTVVSLERTEQFWLDEDAILQRVATGTIDLVMLASPNNPTGDCLTADFVERLLAASDALVVIDQAYVEFAQPQFDLTGLLSRHQNLALLRTFSKAYGLAGLRLGYLLASPAVIAELIKVRQPYSVDSYSAAAGKAVLGHSNEVLQLAQGIAADRDRLAGALAALPGVEVFPSEANYLLLRVAGAQELWQRLYDDFGILLRDFSAAPGLTDCLRVSVGTPEQNQQLLQACSLILGTLLEDRL
ncbi:MAG: histidinol-phosphate transaminase [Coriobacteriales bacterium]|jgi:histidinol-phosphate aminotransferase|nr:histidinol-phosphate transaminase [Coriobacteriales bacterium]